MGREQRENVNAVSVAMPQQIAEADPQDQEKYFDSQGYPPDVPAPRGMGEMFTQLVSNDDYGEDLQKDYPWIFNRDNVLTFVDDNIKQGKMLGFEILKIDNMMREPYMEFTFTKERDWSVLHHIFETKIDRSMGFKQNERVNERVLQQSMFHEQRQVMRDETQNGGQRDNFLKRILGRK